MPVFAVKYINCCRRLHLPSRLLADLPLCMARKCGGVRDHRILFSISSFGAGESVLGGRLASTVLHPMKRNGKMEAV